MIVKSSCCGQALALPAAMTWISPSSCCCSGLFCCCFCCFLEFLVQKKERKKTTVRWKKKEIKKAATMATSGDEGSNLLETPSWIDKFLTQIRAAAADSSGELVVPFKPRRSLKKGDPEWQQQLWVSEDYWLVVEISKYFSDSQR